MGKKCPPGVICIENVTMTFLIIATCIFLYFYNKSVTRGNYLFATNILNKHTMTTPHPPQHHSSTHIQSDELKYMPVNVRTQGNPHNQSYSQIGILSRTTAEDVIMPLFGRNIHNGRDKWQYYTLTEHNVRLPISVSGKSCTNEYGCDSVGNGDYVYVEGYNDAFKVTIYDDINQLRYIPYL
tara:strand:+ start:274 stop:819 length:546 start_codon:yes stop_codon:yes gene_type:complete